MAETLVWSHFFGMMLFGLVPFFIPLEIWPKRPLWHFLFMFIVMVLGLIIAKIYRKKFQIKRAHICFLSLVTQKIRGYDYNDSRNYMHSQIKEMLQKFGINASPLILWLTLLMGTILTAINLIIYLF